SAWQVPGVSSGMNPPVFAPGEPPSILSPEPPDPTSPLSPVNFPSLAEATPKTVLSCSRKGSRKNSLPSITIASIAEKKLETTTTSSETIPIDLEQPNSTSPTVGTVSESRSDSATVP
ncbi:unnamed protein product, partial [Brassica oleracea]